jgi:hypothetical protein
MDLGPVRKMRDVYPLVITRIEHMTTLLLNDATAEAVVWLPLKWNPRGFQTIVSMNFLVELCVVLFRELFISW